LSLNEIIINKIRTEGPLSFHDFMDMCLYYPGMGYYTSGGEKIGKSGDYCTSPYFTGLFGQLIAKQLEEMWRSLGEKEFTIVEYGAGTGVLCSDILRSAESLNPEFYDSLRYCII
jgi:SAM-dependent MidA family methyltransferase